MIRKSLIFDESEIYNDDMCLELDKVNISYLNSDHLQEAIQMIIVVGKLIGMPTDRPTDRPTNRANIVQSAFPKGGK